MEIHKRNLMFLVLSVLVCCLINPGCTLLESATKNVGTWDISACVSGFSTCWKLFWDNSEKFEDGFITAIDGLGPQS